MRFPPCVCVCSGAKLKCTSELHVVLHFFLRGPTVRQRKKRKLNKERVVSARFRHGRTFGSYLKS
jgi:hypothetical protein